MSRQGTFVPSGSFRENPFPCCSQFLEAACVPWYMASRHSISAFTLTSPLALTLLPLLIRTLGMTLGSQE